MIENGKFAQRGKMTAKDREKSLGDMASSLHERLIATLRTIIGKSSKKHNSILKLANKEMRASVKEARKRMSRSLTKFKVASLKLPPEQDVIADAQKQLDAVSSKVAAGFNVEPQRISQA